jgi:signal transduction histidine kinase
MVRAELEGKRAAAISVIDDEIGIDSEDLPRVFERFYRTDQSHRHGIGGTGLGLAVALAVVEAHGGTVSVTSDGPGQGAAVTFLLPLDR